MNDRLPRLLVLGFLFLSNGCLAGLYHTLHTRPVTAINRQALQFPASLLRYYYEPDPAASTSAFPAPDWLTTTPVNTISADALHERFSYAPEHPSSTYRIVTLGDSLTYGLFVDTADNYPEQLEDRLAKLVPCGSSTKFEVINLGVPGYDLAYAAERFRLRGERYRPDLVIWLVHQGNFYKIQDLITARLREQPALLRQPDPPEVARRAILAELGEAGVLGYQQRVLESFRAGYTGQLLLFVPSAWIWGEPRRLLERMTARPDTHLAVASTDLNGTGMLFPDNHPTARGYTALTAELVEFLQRQPFFPCHATDRERTQP